MPLVTIRYWAGARRAAGRDSEQLTATDLPSLLVELRSRPELAEVVAACSVLVDSAAPGTNVALPNGAVIDILPPFAGG